MSVVGLESLLMTRCGHDGGFSRIGLPGNVLIQSESGVVRTRSCLIYCRIWPRLRTLLDPMEMSVGERP